MFRWIAAVGGAAMLAAGIGAAWWFRPWSPYSPAAITHMMSPAERAQNFRHMERFMPYHWVRAGASAYALPRRVERVAVHYDWPGSAGTIDALMQRVSAMGLVVVHDGSVVEERFVAPPSAHGETASATRSVAVSDDRFTSWSVAKSFVSTLLGIAISEGKIRSIDDKVADYVPELRGSAYGETSLQDLLRMTSGVAWNDDFSNSKSDVIALYKNAFVFGDAVDPFVSKHIRAAPQGARFNYASSDPQILGLVIRRATGMSLADYLGAKVWQPMGMRGDAFWSTDQHGSELAFCCLSAQLEDYARFGAMLSQGGVWEGRQIVPRSWIEASSALHDDSALAGANHHHGADSYGFLWWIPTDPQGEFFAHGVFGQVIWVDTRRHVAVAMAATDPDANAHRGEIIAAMRAICAAYAPS